MDTGAAGDASPWRIKVTVEAEPQDGSSPSKRMTRTTKVPLKGSSSPAKKNPAKKALQAEESEADIKRPQRKRKGTPIRRNVKRASPARVLEDEDVFTDGRSAGQIEMSQALQVELSSPSKGPTTRSKRKGTPKPSPAERARRLSKAQAQLEALGGAEDSDDHNQAEDSDAEVLPSDAAPGDMTVANEDFTMISVATLESMKQGNTSLLLDNSQVGDKSAASVSYMPSSPPQLAREQNSSSSYARHGDEEQHLEASRQKDMTSESEQATKAANIYDEMSWKPTGPLKTSSLLAKSNKPQGHHQPIVEAAEYRLQREAVSREIENAKASDVITVDSSHSSTSDGQSIQQDDDQATFGAEQPEDDDVEEGAEEGAEEDIWAEEASRSLEESQPEPPQQERPSSTAAALNEIFSDQVFKPPRGKIPRTWRRTSGMDFSYVDSPAHELLTKPATETRKVSATSAGSSGDGGGVLTPPDSSFDEDDNTAADESNEDQLDVDLTHPDAAATQLQVEEGEPVPTRRQNSDVSAVARVARRSRDTATNTSQVSVSSASTSNSLSSNVSNRSDTRNENEDTGMFWQSNLPNVFQQTRQRKWGSKLLEERRNRAKTHDLSEILKSSSTIDVEQKSSEGVSVSQSEESNREEGARSALRHVDKQREKVVRSPLRKSLLRSSKIGGDALPTDTGLAATGLTSNLQDKHMPSPGSGTDGTLSESDCTLGESFESKASDQRQLLAEMNLDSARSTSHKHVLQVDETEVSEEAFEDDVEQHPMSEATYDGQTPDNRNRSHFWDPSVDGESYDEDDEEQPEEHEHDEDGYENDEEEDAQPACSYEERLNLDSPLKIRVKFNDSEGNSSMLAPKKAYPPLFVNENEPFRTISTQKQTASTASSPSEQGPGLISRLTSTIWSALIRPSGPNMVDPTPEPEFPPSVRTQIRSRYGVLSDQYPWTIAHMRTLHRLLNSCTSNKYDSLVPKSGPVPAALKSLIGKEVQCVTEFRWKFTEQHAHVVDAFMQVLVPSHYIDSMRKGEVDFIGDDFALLCRGEWAGRHGDDLVWDGETIAYYSYLQKWKGSIERSFVVRALGNAVSANIETAKREAKEKLERERIEAERRAWERRMGVVHDDDDEGHSTEELSTMDS